MSVIKTDSNRATTIKNALVYVPNHVKNEFLNNNYQITIYSTHDRFGLCFTPSVGSFNILINDTIFPSCYTQEDNSYRFFVFTILHEIAHVYLTLHGQLIGDQDEAQADEIAISWYNERAITHKLPALTPDLIHDMEPSL